MISAGRVAELVEQRTENPRVVGSIPTPATILRVVEMNRHCVSPDVRSPTPGNPARSKGNSDAKVSIGARFDGEALASGMGSAWA
jgi:hypothetical protein